MKTDTLFYKIFQDFPQLLFQLLDRSFIPGYTFTSVEVKEKGFRFDGIFVPPIDAVNEPIFFIEVQFQYNPSFYWEFLSEIFLYLNQQKPSQDWIAVAIFADGGIDVKNLSAAQQEMVNSGRIVRIYLDELPDRSVEFGMLRLITCPQEKTVEVVNQIRSVSRAEVIIESIKMILVYKFPTMGREAIEAMFTLDDLRQTRVFQEIQQESLQRGRQQEATSLLLRLVTRRFGSLPPDRIAQISNLPIDQLEELGEAFLDFTTIDHLYAWLDR